MPRCSCPAICSCFILDDVTTNGADSYGYHTSIVKGRGTAPNPFTFTFYDSYDFIAEAARITSSSPQAIPANTDTEVLMDTVVYDPYHMCDGDNHLVTPTFPIEGVYLFGGEIEYIADASAIRIKLFNSTGSFDRGAASRSVFTVGANELSMNGVFYQPTSLGTVDPTTLNLEVRVNGTGNPITITSASLWVALIY